MKENMKIQLHQTEIEQSLRLYLIKEGFVLQGKAVNIEFTAGRKAGGLIADIFIDDKSTIQLEPTPEVEADADETSSESDVITAMDIPQVGTSKPVAIEEATVVGEVVSVEEADAPKPSLFS